MQEMDSNSFKKRLICKKRRKKVIFFSSLYRKLIMDEEIDKNKNMY